MTLRASFLVALQQNEKQKHRKKICAIDTTNKHCTEAPNHTNAYTNRPKFRTKQYFTMYVCIRTRKKTTIIVEIGEHYVHKHKHIYKNSLFAHCI